MKKSILYSVTIILLAVDSEVAHTDEVVSESVATALHERDATVLHRTVVMEFRAKVERHFRDPYLSPLTEPDRMNFARLSYFEIGAEYSLPARFVAETDDSVFAMPTFNNKTLNFTHYGTLTFDHAGSEVRLKVFRRLLGEHLSRTVLIPFRDATNGDETYAGGRYIEMDLPLQEPLHLDFNRAMNPWCAYNPNYACPIPPPENYLSFPIRAGEKRFK